MRPYQFLRNIFRITYIYLEIALKKSCTAGQPTDQCVDTNAECNATSLTCGCKSTHIDNKDGACNPSKTFWKHHSNIIIWMHINILWNKSISMTSREGI